jgi:hypothetical protein
MSQVSAIDEQALDRDSLAREVARRRTFAIISHPDAGKTTLTEKLLLYAGAIELAGAVRGRKTRRHVTSDWMEMEQQRGISISAAALEFEMDGHHVQHDAKQSACRSVDAVARSSDPRAETLGASDLPNSVVGISAAHIGEEHP